MRRVFSIAFLHFKTLFKTPSAIVLMFVMPIMFSLIFGGMGIGESSGNKAVVLIVASENEVNEKVVNLLSSNTQYTWREEEESAARELVKNQEAIAAVKIDDSIEESFGKSTTPFSMIVQRKTQEYMALSNFIEGLGSTLYQAYRFSPDTQTYILLLENLGEREAIEVSQSVIQKQASKSEAVGMMAIGFTIMFMMFGISGAASAILEERVGGTWQRLLTSPATKAQVMTGYLLSYFLMGAIQLAVLMIVMKGMYGSSWGRLTYFIPFAVLVIVTIVGFSLMMATIVKTRQQSSALSALVIVSTCMLGGVYWPIEIVPEFMQQIAKAVPQSWMITGFREIVSGSLHLPSILYATIVLLIFSIVFYGIGLKKIKYQ
ncbi:ABC transporter permease [Mesobacillus subterraneus]|uniref:ABC transporter permease n=1 Tax=Mesobacillus subterraneus TaxID=285983 RepID=A0A3R9FDS5_9BACI|nr:ABC transporter permease [Mesobacillus subterraneus]RSD23036.1 ABC transporter permease [Mesobacillus subterraneus]